MYDRLYRLLRLCVVPGALAGFSGLASATVITSASPIVAGVSGGYNVLYQDGASLLDNLLSKPIRTIAPSLINTGDAVISESLAITGAGTPAGGLAVRAATTLTAGEVGLAAVSTLARVANPLLLIGSLALALDNLDRIKAAGDGKNVLRDDGIDPQTGMVTQYLPLRNGNPIGNWTSSFGAAQAQVLAFYANSNTANNTLSLGETIGTSAFYISQTQCNPVITSVDANGTNYTTQCSTFPQAIYIDVATRQVSATACPAMGAANAPATPSGDGKCPTGVYKPITIAAAAAAVAATLKNLPTSSPDLVTKTISEGGSVSTTSSPVVTGPSTAQGSPQTTTTTAPDGTVSTQTVTPTYNYTYNGSKIDYTTVYNNSSTTNNSTITTTKTGPDYTDPCIANPTRAGCSTIGDIPEDKFPIPADAPFSISPVVLSSSAGCPAPVTFTLPHLGQYSITYQPLCDFLSTWMAALVNVMAVVYSAKVFMGGLRT